MGRWKGHRSRKKRACFCSSSWLRSKQRWRSIDLIEVLGAGCRCKRLLSSSSATSISLKSSVQAAHREKSSLLTSLEPKVTSHVQRQRAPNIDDRSRQLPSILMPPSGLKSGRPRVLVEAVLRC